MNDLLLGKYHMRMCWGKAEISFNGEGNWHIVNVLRQTSVCQLIATSDKWMVLSRHGTIKHKDNVHESSLRGSLIFEKVLWEMMRDL